MALTDGSPARLKRSAEALLRPMTAVPTSVHEGSLPSRQSLLDFKAGHSVMCSVRIAEDGALAVRLFEAEGVRDSATLRPRFAIRRACLTDLEGHVLSEIRTDGKEATFDLDPCQLVEARLYPDKQE